MSKPLLSIVIANYNYGHFLEDAIKSILSQDVGDQVEIIICDGGSTDNSVEIIKKYAGKLAWWCSEKDGGQSAAFNKGFAHARGKYLTWLNADDVFMPGCLPKIVQKVKTHPDCHWFTGNFIRFMEDGRVMDVGWGPHWFPRLLQRRNSPLVIFGPTTFFSREIYNAYGPIDERMHLMMDIDLWQRFIVAGVKQIRLNMLVWAFRMHEASKTAEFGEHVLDDRRVKMFAGENRMAYERTGYRCSRLMRVLCLALRVFDGSFVARQWLRWTCRRFTPGGVA